MNNNVEDVQKKVVEVEIEKGINFAVNELEQKLIKDISESRMPISIIRLALNNLINDIKEVEKKQVIQERQSYLDELNKKRSEGGKELCQKEK